MLASREFEVAKTKIVKCIRWRDNRAVWIALVLLLILGASLRFHGLTLQSYWMDELHSASYSQPNQGLKRVVARVAEEVHPPLYQVSLWFTYKLLGFSEWSGRFLSAFFGMFGLVFIFLLGSSLLNQKAGLYAVALTTPMFFHLFYSQEVRSYSLLFCVTIACYLALFALIRKPEWKRSLVYAFFATILVYTHYFGIFVLLAHVVLVGGLVIWNNRRYRPLLGWCFFAAILVGISFAPWMPAFASNTMLTDTWIEPVGPDFVWSYIRYYFASGFNLVMAGSFLLFLVGYFPLFRAAREKSALDLPVWWILISWIVTTLGVPYIVTISVVPVLIPRVTTIMLPALIMLLSWPLARLKQPLVIVCSLLMALLLTVSLVQRDLYFRREWKNNWRGAVQHVLTEDPEARYPVVGNWSWYYQPYFSLLGHPRKVIYAPNFPLERNSKRISAAGGFWFLDSHKLLGPPPEMRPLLARSFIAEKEVSFLGASVVFYRFRETRSGAGSVAAEPLFNNDILMED